MGRFIAGADRHQTTLFPPCVDDWIDEENPVRAVDAFVGALDLAEVGFGVEPAATGRPSYHPSVLLKLYIYGYLNRVQSSRRLEREANRNVELMWLVGRLAPDHKTIADFRRDNGAAIRQVCARFVLLCRSMGLLAGSGVAIDGSKFKAVNNRDRNFTKAKLERRRQQVEESVARYLSQLDTADRQEPDTALAAKADRLKEKIARLEEEMKRLDALEAQMLSSPDQQVSLTDPDARSMSSSVPLGYDVVDRKLIVNEAEAETVRLIFERHRAVGTLAALVDDLAARGVTSKRRKMRDGRIVGGASYTAGALTYLLRNALYAGRVRHGDQVYPGEHRAILDVATWEASQALLDRSAPRPHTGQISLLAGLVCDPLGDEQLFNGRDITRRVGGEVLQDTPKNEARS